MRKTIYSVVVPKTNGTSERIEYTNYQDAVEEMAKHQKSELEVYEEIW